MGLHLMEQYGKSGVSFPKKGNDLMEKIGYTVDEGEPEKGRVWINKEQYFEGVRPEV